MTPAPTHSGFYALRFTLPIDSSFLADPKLAWILKDGGGCAVRVICDKGTKRLTVYPVRGGRVLNVACLTHRDEAGYLDEIGK